MREFKSYNNTNIFYLLSSHHIWASVLEQREVENQNKPTKLCKEVLSYPKSICGQAENMHRVGTVAEPC